jgi:4-aminobutyrate aminotransferase/(S)-3-amino-2-methylpropionate transaminase
MGDPIRALQAREMIRVIKDHNLVEATASVGHTLFSALSALSRTPHGAPLIQNLRGQDRGTFIAFDAETPAKRDELVARLKMKGVNAGGCGERAVRLRPMLIFGEDHAAIFLSKLEEVLKEMA